jgi:hypothetical protein
MVSVDFIARFGKQVLFKPDEPVLTRPVLEDYLDGL